MPDCASVTGRWRALVIGAVVALVFVVLRVWPFVGSNIGRGIDSFDYRASARFSLWSRDFVAGPRPLGYPLYLKFVGSSDHVAVVGQLILSTVAWLTLAYVVARATRHPVVRVVAVAAVLCIGASFESIQWDRIVSSEALSTALGVLLLAALIWLYDHWSTPVVVAVGVLALAATLVRDSNGTFFGVVAVVLFAGAVLRRIPTRVAVVGAALLAVALVGSLSASGGRRWEGPLKDVITLRVLESPERTAYFRAAGMPLTDAEIAAARGRCVVPAPPSACVVIDNPAFYRWIRDHGRSTYLKSMLRFPATTVWEPVAHGRESIGSRVQVELPYAADTAENAPVSKLFEALVFWRNPVLVALGALAVFVAAVVALVRGLRGVFVIGAALVALAYPHLWLVWTGGALEVARHSILASFQLRLGIWLGACWIVDAVLVARSRPDTASLAPATSR